MRLRSAKMRNFRTLEKLEITFPSSYAAICGPNDSGKTNVVRALRTIVRDDSPGFFVFSGDESSRKDDYPKWKDTEAAKREVSIEIEVEIDNARDIGFHQFIVAQLKLDKAASVLGLCIEATYHAEKPEPKVRVSVGSTVEEGINAQQVLKKLQSSGCILFHNSTEASGRFVYPRGSVAGHIREITGQHEPLVESLKKTVSRGLARISKSQQTEFEDLLGRLQTKYKVGLSLPPFDFGYLPFSITLGDKKMEVPLDDWGSGTKNRTLILLALFRARQVGTADPSASKITPVLIIEEPESFLHPSAQAEFGRVLQDLAEEFQVQVVVTTHSPYLLNLKKPEANILLSRKRSYGQLRETERIDTSGEHWMAPFGVALGLQAEEFKPWKAMMISGSDSILLVEGETDLEYFTMLRKQEHGANRLLFDGEIVSYEGTGSLSNTVLLRFIKNRHRKFFVTFDLDSIDRVEKTLKSLQLLKNQHYVSVGQNAAGKRNVEGLLPGSITKAVFEANPDLVQAATAGTKEEQDNAKRKLKRLMLEEFKAKAKPNQEFFGGFYAIAKIINKALG